MPMRRNADTAARKIYDQRMVVRMIFAVLAIGVNVAEAVYVAADTSADDRNHSHKAYCDTKGQMCWIDESECADRKLTCESVRAYACFKATAITGERGTKWCLRRYGDCADYREGVLRDREYTDVTQCLVYRHE